MPTNARTLLFGLLIVAGVALTLAGTGLFIAAFPVPERRAPAIGMHLTGWAADIADHALLVQPRRADTGSGDGSLAHCAMAFIAAIPHEDELAVLGIVRGTLAADDHGEQEGG